MANVRFLNNGGGGFLEEIEVPDGTTVAQFLTGAESGGVGSGRVSGQVDDYKISVNHAPEIASKVLVDGDLISATLLKQEGAI